MIKFGADNQRIDILNHKVTTINRYALTRSEKEY